MNKNLEQLLQLMTDLSALVRQQGDKLDSVELDCARAREFAEKGHEEMEVAIAYVS